MSDTTEPHADDAIGRHMAYAIASFPERQAMANSAPSALETEALNAMAAAVLAVMVNEHAEARRVIAGMSMPVLCIVGGNLDYLRALITERWAETLTTPPGRTHR